MSNEEEIQKNKEGVLIKREGKLKEINEQLQEKKEKPPLNRTLLQKLEEQEQQPKGENKKKSLYRKFFGGPNHKKNPPTEEKKDNQSNESKGKRLARAAYTAEREKQAVKYGKERARIETRTRLKKYKKELASEKPHAPTQQPHPLQPMLTPSTIPNLHTPRLATGRMSWPQPEQRSENLFTPPNIHTSQLITRTPHFQHPQKPEKHPTRKKKTTMAQKQQHINIFKPSKMFR